MAVLILVQIIMFIFLFWIKSSPININLVSKELVVIMKKTQLIQYYFIGFLARFFYSSTVNRPNRINFVINVIALLFFNFSSDTLLVFKIGISSSKQIFYMYPFPFLTFHGTLKT